MNDIISNLLKKDQEDALKAFCHQCGQFVPNTWITYEEGCNEYCIECELDMKITELCDLVKRIDFLKANKDKIQNGEEIYE